jgi:deferrochelatase/peroxidase EfeB
MRMTHAMVTTAIPFEHVKAPAVDALLKTFRNQLFGGGAIRNAMRGKGIHFMSITAVRGDGDEPTHLVLEISADGTADDAYASVVSGLQSVLPEIFTAAGIRQDGDLKAVLAAHRVRTGQGLFDVPGLDFPGTPGMSVDRILKEHALARRLRDHFDVVPLEGSALGILQGAHAVIQADAALAPLLTAEPVARIAARDPSRLDLGFIGKLVLNGLLLFFWPVLAVLGLLVAGVTWLAVCAQGLVVGAIALVTALMVAVLALVAVVIAVYVAFRKREADNTPIDTALDPAVMESLVEAENIKDTQQNHLAGISLMQPGRVRGLSLRVGLWVIGQMVAHRFRPGFLGDISTIHFARWVRLPNTNKLLFFSNYGGSWESYLEDFITKASSGLTAVWSNTLGFPQTENLFFKGATDGDRFKRWARRQQQPTWFWYSAYPALTTARIRANAAIRQGLCLAKSEDEATAWLGLFGSRVRPATPIETFEVQTLMYGGLSKHPHSRCIAIRLPADAVQARAWLRSVEGRVTFGDQPSPEEVLILALSHTGLGRLGLSDAVREAFSPAFKMGMGSRARANLLADTGDDKAETWLWGGPGNDVDATLLVYTDTGQRLEETCRLLVAGIESFGGGRVHQVTPTPLPDVGGATSAKAAVREPFGFADGISQPIVKGTRRWMRQSDAIHAVEPGEFILGYPDTRGYFPPSPVVEASAGGSDLLPLASAAHTRDAHLPVFDLSGDNGARDLGRNGSYLVIRQLAQDVDAFNTYLDDAARTHAGHPAVPTGLDPKVVPEWIGAKMVGRWKDGSSLVRFPHRPATYGATMPNFRPDNEFLYGAEDPVGERCPMGSHIRRANPRDSQAPLSSNELAIVNRHRILRVGRGFDAEGANDTAENKPGLLFMCLNADIERQFEFIQQTWLMAWQFHGLENESDTLLSRGKELGRLTIPSPRGPLNLKGFKDFVRMRGGAYLFMPSRSALRYLGRP